MPQRGRSQIWVWKASPDEAFEPGTGDTAPCWRIKYRQRGSCGRWSRFVLLTGTEADLADAAIVDSIERHAVET